MTKKELEILRYCEMHLDKMWALKIASIILECPFSDVRPIYERLKPERPEHLEL